MSSITIYMEGGGKGKENRAALRLGMDAFLQSHKEAARDKALHWKLVCCGPRDEAFKRFRNAVNGKDATVFVLLVDAEGPVNQSIRDHLRSRDGWNLSFASEDTVHLMVQTMETWIVADSTALRKYYGQGFKVNQLPKTTNLETVPRADIELSLREATKGTQKGRYQKNRHASDLLKRIDVKKVKGSCAYCQRLFNVLGPVAGLVQFK